MSLTRRRFLQVCGAAAPVAVAAQGDQPRFDLGIASGHPTAGSVVLWTRLTGGDLPEQVVLFV